MPRGIARLPFVLAALVFAACTHAIPLNLNPALERPPSVVPIPLAVGVYYSPQFRDYRHAESKYGDRWDFPLGPASVAALERAWPLLFEAVRPVTSRPPLPTGTPAVAAVIEPTIEEFTFGLPVIKSGTYTAGVAYRFTAYSPQGQSLASWTVRGEGAKPGQFGFEFSRWPGEATDLAIQDAARRLVTGFRMQAAVQPWLAQAGVRLALETAGTTALAGDGKSNADGAAASLAPASAVAAMLPPPGTGAVPGAEPPRMPVALVGTWVGTLVTPAAGIGSVGSHPMTRLRVWADGGRLRWTMDVQARGLDASGTVTKSDALAPGEDEIELSGKQAGRDTTIRYVLTLKGDRLEGSGVTGDNRVHVLSLSKSP